ncbi:penicillin-binding protein activator [Janthinobacterium sp. 17J80-10]|uniref:penicillin-binding protein activator n=1 Tax=Janthinobacterium sp. 17J80-10 TaxID=2497863 RepID=UPI00100557D6|nr:penicillin-binding protein activator [Janthinobacterium sp. 17J80-10]QAU33202.1 hypothetical protein EKL02_02850 [Janthinobacterium sp. 17J80-10]
MLDKAVKTVLLGLVCGLCAPALANTTTNAAAASDDGAAAPARTRIAIVLPTLSDTFSTAAQALRAGFMAAHEREPDGIEVTLVESADGAQNALSAYESALAQNDIVVGPLARADVAAIARSGKVAKPTLTLAPADADIALPAQALAIGLSIEDEARQLATWAGAGRKQAKAVVIAGGVAWQRRAARAFAAQWQELGLEALPVEIASSSGYLSAAGLEQVRKRLMEEKPAVVFFGLDAFQAQQMQLALPKGLAPAPHTYGTSQLNPWNAADWRSAEKRIEMNGVRLLDLPWLLQPDHPAVMVYPRPVMEADRRANPDLDRLYALGIDAYRVAREIAAHRTAFELDGVTGRLSVNFAAGNYRLRRAAQPAAYQDGMVAPLPRMP